MKKVLFIIFTILSLIGYALAGVLLGAHFRGESVGMVMIFLIPLLIFGLFSGLAALYLKSTKIEALNKFVVGLHYLNLILIGLGIVALIYTYLE